MHSGYRVLLFLAAALALIGNGQGQKRRSSPPTASQVVDFDCPEEFGYYAHPADCSQYYVCVFGGALLESCTSGLMYSHELQTCDWPRNVGCGEGTGNSGATVVSQQSEVSRSRPSVQQASRVIQQTREPQPIQKVITKHDLYTEEELGPAEEIETDRQQRVYRGQPPTIGQVASDRDAISTHSNAIPVPSSGGRDKLSVVSYGPQQQYNRASVAPQQAYVEQVTSTPTRTYNASQYVPQQYDPYYNLYDEEADLYKDIDYSQYTSNQGSQGQRYRTPVGYKDRKLPTVEIVQQEPVQRGQTYTKSKFNSQQDLYQPAVTQEDYESYSIQTNDDVQYRQPVQTKPSNRLAPNRGTEGTPGSKEEKLLALPEGVERNQTLGTQRIALKTRFSHSDPITTVRPALPSREDRTERATTTTTDSPRQITQSTESTSNNYIVQKTDTESTQARVSKQYNPEPLPTPEKLIQPRQPFVIQVASPKPEASSAESRRASYELIKQFLAQGRQLETPRPFSRAKVESGSDKPNIENQEASQQKGHFILSSTPARGNTERIGSFDRVKDRTEVKNTPQKTYRGRQEEKEKLDDQRNNVALQNNERDRTSSYIRTPQAPTKPNNNDNTPKILTSKNKPVLVEQYSITSAPVPSRLSLEPDYYSYQSQDIRRNNYEKVENTHSRRPIPSRVSPDTVARVEYSTTKRPTTTTTSPPPTTEHINIRRPTTIRPDLSRENIRKLVASNSEASDSDRSNRRRIVNRGPQRNQQNFRIVIDNKNSEITESKQLEPTVFDLDTPDAEKVRNDYKFSTTKILPPKIVNKPLTTTQTLDIQTNTYRKDTDINTNRYSKVESNYQTEQKTPQIITTVETIEPAKSNDADKRSFDSFPSNIQCTSNCNDKQIIRVRPTSYDIQTTPGITRGNSRHRGSLTYTVSPNEAEPAVNRGTPTSVRARPTLKPSTSIVSKAAEFIDIYKFPPRRPDPVYPTPQVDKTAAKCRKDVCLLPDCYCGGKDVPGELPLEETPQIVLLTFDDSVNDLNKGLYSDLFEKGRTNPNGCPISATFYVSHEWTDYSQVQNLYSTGHEIASHSVSHSFGEQFSQKKWTREIAGQREILSAYGGVKQEDIRGMRAPFLAVGGNKMFKMLHDSNFTYDSSMPVYENKPPSWPYTMDYKIFHDCMIPPCPTRSYPGVWEVPMVMWQDLNGGRCSMGDACSNPPTADGVYKMLIKNFERHFTSNRAPFGLFYHAAWFTQPHHKEGFIAFLDTIVNMPEVWLVTNWQAIQWVRDPTPISRLNNFAPFQCNYPDRPKKCNNPKVCNLWHKSGVRYMRTCQPCPEVYPWTGKTGVRNSRVDNEIFQE